MALADYLKVYSLYDTSAVCFFFNLSQFSLWSCCGWMLPKKKKRVHCALSLLAFMATSWVD